ncbi:MAG: mismatch-specific DNA-glycosylase, partial [Chitinispirillaceae bacterium]
MLERLRVGISEVSTGKSFPETASFLSNMYFFSMDPFKPTSEQIQAAWGKTVPDVIAPDLKILFCGINPSLYTGAVGHHFARPGNRFWPSLHKAGITPRLFSPFEEEKLLSLGYGITNLVARATAAASDIKRAEFQAGAVDLEKKSIQFNPTVLA